MNYLKGPLKGLKLFLFIPRYYGKYQNNVTIKMKKNNNNYFSYYLKKDIYKKKG